MNDLQQLQAWVRTGPIAPEGDWYKDFGWFLVCGSGKSVVSVPPLIPWKSFAQGQLFFWFTNGPALRMSNVKDVDRALCLVNVKNDSMRFEYSSHTSLLQNSQHRLPN